MITRFVIVGDHLRAVQPDDVEAAVTVQGRCELNAEFDRFDADKRVTVAGAARSGMAAAELLARRGARVTLSDTRSRGAGGRAADARWACSSSSAATRPRRSRARIWSCSARACRRSQPAIAGRARSRRAGHRRGRARVALAAGPRDCDHRHQRQVDDDGADRPDARSRRLQGDGRRQHRRAAERAGGRVDARHAARRRDEQLSARADRHVPSVDRRDAELLAGPSRSASDASRRTRRRRRGSSRTRTRATGRSSTPTTRRCSSWRAAAARRRRLFARSGSIAAGHRGRGRLDRRSPSRTSPSGSCRSTRSTCSGPHLVDDVMAAATVGAIAGAAPAAMTAAVDAFHGLEHAMELVAERRRRPLRQRLEGDQRRVGAAVDRELRARIWCRSSAGGSRAATCGCCASRCGARAKAVVAIGEAQAAGPRGARRTLSTCTRPSRSRRRSTTAFALAQAVRRGAARAGVRELRHVSRLRGAGTALQGGGCKLKLRAED